MVGLKWKTCMIVMKLSGYNLRESTLTHSVLSFTVVCVCVFCCCVAQRPLYTAMFMYVETVS